MKKNLIRAKEICILDIYNNIPITKKYTKKTINQNEGEVPVYSSQYLSQGTIGFVNFYNYPIHLC